MAIQRDAGHDNPALVDGVAENLGMTYWSVDDCGWLTIHPTLPAHLADLLAPPIVVGVVPIRADTSSVAADSASVNDDDGARPAVAGRNGPADDRDGARKVT